MPCCRASNGRVETATDDGQRQPASGQQAGMGTAQPAGREVAGLAGGSGSRPQTPRALEMCSSLRSWVSVSHAAREQRVRLAGGGWVQGYAGMQDRSALARVSEWVSE